MPDRIKEWEDVNDYAKTITRAIQNAMCASIPKGKEKTKVTKFY